MVTPGLDLNLPLRQAGFPKKGLQPELPFRTDQDVPEEKGQQA